MISRKLEYLIALSKEGHFAARRPPVAFHSWRSLRAFNNWNRNWEFQSLNEVNVSSDPLPLFIPTETGIFGSSHFASFLRLFNDLKFSIVLRLKLAAPNHLVKRCRDGCMVLGCHLIGRRKRLAFGALHARL
jgi:hypothetical protein